MWIESRAVKNLKQEVKNDNFLSNREKTAMKEALKKDINGTIAATREELSEFILNEYSQATKKALEKKWINAKKWIQVFQKAVWLVPDGYYGKNTFRAIVKYQAKHWLLLDGIIGMQTLRSVKWKKVEVSNRTSKERKKTEKNTKNFFQILFWKKRKNKNSLSKDKPKKRIKGSFENTANSSSLKKYLKNPTWEKWLRKLISSVDNLERKPLAMVSNISKGKTLVIKNWKAQEVSALFWNGTTPRKLRYAYWMNLASGPNVDASNSWKSTTVLWGVLDFWDTKHVHGVQEWRSTTRGCIWLNTNYMYNLCKGLLPNAYESPWAWWKQKRKWGVNKYGFRSEAGTTKRYKLKTRIPVLTV